MRIWLSFSIFPAKFRSGTKSQKDDVTKTLETLQKHCMIVNLVYDFLIYSSNLCSKEPDKLWG